LFTVVVGFTAVWLCPFTKFVMMLSMVVVLPTSQKARSGIGWRAPKGALAAPKAVQR
jgi:hypothetical protein